jgi:adenosine deaminase
VHALFAHDEPLAELHAHLGGGVDAAKMWELAHEQGIKVPYSDYWSFAAATNVGAGTAGLEGLDRIYHLTELIQSSPEGVFQAVHGMLAGGYRAQRITTHEVRFNPAKRNRGGERDLDAIVMAAAHGVDRAGLEYPVRAGLILMMDRGFPMELNAAIVERAIRFRDRGVVAIDIGGPRPRGTRPPYPYRELAPLVARAREAGLGVTLHAGEEGVNAPDPEPFVEEMRQVLALGVDRIGHGIIAGMEPRLLEEVLRREVVLEICPTSNVRTGAVRDEVQIAEIVYTLQSSGVAIVISTDGPEMIGTRLRAEHAMLVRLGALTPAQARAANDSAHRVSFVRGRPWDGHPVPAGAEAGAYAPADGRAGAGAGAAPSPVPSAEPSGGAGG